MILSKLPAGTVVYFEGRAGKLLAAAHLEFAPVVEAPPPPPVVEEAPPVPSRVATPARRSSK